MTTDLKICTLVRVGKYFGNVEGSLKKFRGDFIPLLSFSKELEKFGCYEESTPNYMMIVNHYKNYESIQYDFNLGITVTSFDNPFNERVISQFTSTTGIIGLAEPKNRLSLEAFTASSIAFPILLRHGRSGFEFLNRNLTALEKIFRQ